ncbi:Zinc finger BED domain-containing protein 1 [Merluccius polli]|uniref:Zinc finger BED domain-containing protein 1 n=1 Tax=Merluccius polli TaxID=89951 RepID=A0AA47N7M9_MERPO|nr:Zinc finger BED domain-containing protein 1 [Merluccius polli]
MADSGAETEFITPANLRSDVWNFFGFASLNGQIQSKKTVFCKICKAELTYHSTTSNLRAHLMTIHPGKLNELPQGDGNQPPLKQAKISAFLPPSSSRGLPAARQASITDKLTRFICKDMRPINISQGSGFKDFVHELEPRYTIPSRATITDRVVKLYDTTKDNIIQMISGQKVALTTDGWTSLATEAYVTVTADFINEEWELKDVLLKTIEAPKSHTAENVAKYIGSILDEYKVDRESVLSVTTDNAANYVNAVERHLQAVNVPCMAHTINLAVRKGLAVRAIETPVSRLKATALHFNKSTTDRYQLECKQKLLGVKPAKLINDCATRWNSTYDMVCRAAEQQAPVAAVIMEKKLCHLELSTSEWTLMEQVRAVLKPFKTATEALSTDRFPTASAVLPLKYVLLSHLKPSIGDSAAINDMKTKISTDLEKRYNHDKDAFMLLNTASYLDPHFHRLIHLDRDQQQEVRDKVKSELLVIAEDCGGYEEDEEGAAMAKGTQCTQEKTALSAMGDLFGNVYQDAESTDALGRPTVDIGNVLQQEMHIYESETPLPTDSDPLSWWKASGSSKYSHIAPLARRYLSIPGTSVRAERVFSTAGIIVNKKRSALDPENVDRLVFLANNL